MRFLEIIGFQSDDEVAVAMESSTGGPIVSIVKNATLKEMTCTEAYRPKLSISKYVHRELEVLLSSEVYGIDEAAIPMAP